jgi:hypothetical protein
MLSGRTQGIIEREPQGQVPRSTITRMRREGNT